MVTRRYRRRARPPGRRRRFATGAPSIPTTACVTLENIAEAVLRDDLATEEELREAIEELYAFARDPRTVLGGPRVFQAWGRNRDIDA